MTSFPLQISRPIHPTGIWNWITTIDHKKIGILYGVSAFILFIIGGIEAMLMRAQLASSNLKIIDPELYNQLFTMHGTTMIFLAIMPMGAAFFNYLIPLQIGARDVAFPRLNAFSYWTFLAGAIILNASWFLGGAPNAGWFGYAPITGKAYNVGHGIDFWIISLQVLGIASLAAAFNFIVTIINMRAPGMTFSRLPVFTWMSFITAILLVLAFPVITVALIELQFDRFYGTNFFITSAGGNPILWQHLFWVFGHPEVYILILPAMGIVSEILPTFSKKPLFGYPVVILSGIIIGFMGWMVWSHHMFTVGLGPVANSVFALTTMAIAIPTGVKIFNWLGTLWKGSLTLNTPMLYAIGFILTFTIGGISGVMHSQAASDAQQQDTYFIVAHIHYVLFGGSLIAILGGIYYWFPKFTGRMYDEKMGKLGFYAFFIAMQITFFPMHFTGLNGMPRRIYTYGSEYGWDFWNLISTIGVLLLAISMVIFIYNIVSSWIGGEKASGDPWDARTLEWSISSPPPEYNFAVIPTIEYRDDWWEKKMLGKTSEEITSDDVHLPQPSYWPFIASLGLLVAGFGIILSIPVAILGASITMIGVYAWSFEPVNDPH
ncbi:MAG: cytochrome c oxidase subunit I [SAR202 cluster bacterium]|nr:cytochrome c oxidase subunit I [SAR202 cluster bacterium]